MCDKGAAGAALLVLRIWYFGEKRVGGVKVYLNQCQNSRARRDERNRPTLSKEFSGG